MRTSFAILAAAGMLLFGVSAANAAPLTSANLTLTAFGVSISITAPSSTPPRPAPGGGYVQNSIAIDAGSAFATTKTVSVTGIPALSKLRFVVGANGGIRATRGGAVSFTQHTTSGAPVGIQAQVTWEITGGAPFIGIPLNVGGGGTITGLNGAGLYNVTVIGNPWTLGQAVQSNLTVSGSPIPNQTLTGSFGIDPTSLSGSVKLVSASRLIIGPGLAQTQAITATLTMVPEPGTLLLLGAGMAGLVALGRRKRA